MPCRSGSPHGVFSPAGAAAAGDCACVRVSGAETTAPTAAVVIATRMIESEKRSRIGVSCWLAVGLLERVLLDAHEVGGIVLGGRTRTASLCERQVLDPRRPQHGRERIVSFDAARLVVDPVLLLALSGELLADGPGSRPYGRVLDGHHVFERVRAGPGPALDQVQVLTRALNVGLRTEVGDVDHQRIAVPMAA